MVVSHLQKFICTSLVLWWMVEGVKDKTERTNKDQELIWIFYTWVGFFSSSNVDCDELQTLLEVLLIERWCEGVERKRIFGAELASVERTHQHLAGKPQSSPAAEKKKLSILSSPDTAAHKFSLRFHKHWRLFWNSLVRITNADCSL